MESPTVHWHFSSENIRPPLPGIRERFGHCGVLVPPHFYIVFGGQTAPRLAHPGPPQTVIPAELHGDLAAFNTETREWIAAQLPEAFPDAARSFSACAALGDRVYHFFGRKLPYTPLNDAFFMTASAQEGVRWEPVNKSGQHVAPRWGHSAVALPTSKRILIFGGKQSSDHFSDDLLIYDAETDKYIPVASPSAVTLTSTWPGARGHHCAVGVDDNTMVVFGGRGPADDSPERRSLVWTYDVRQGKWITSRFPQHIATSISDRFGAAACWTNIQGGSIAVLGGRRDSCDENRTVQTLDSSNNPVVATVAEQPPSWLCFNGHGVVSQLTPAPSSMNFNASSLLYPSVSWLPSDPQGSFILWGGFDWRRSACVPSAIVSHLRSERTPNIVPAVPLAAQHALAPSIFSRSQSGSEVTKPKFDPKTVEILQPTEMQAAALAMGASFTLRAQSEAQNSTIRPLMKKVASIDPSLLATESTAQDRPVAKRIISELLRSSTDSKLQHTKRKAVRANGKHYDEWIFAKPEELFELCDQAIAILEKEPTVLRLNAPCKVFGDVHGQITDLLHLFATFGAPTHHGGDIQLVNYLFLGDYVDRGSHSLEVITLLLALKVTYPDRIFLLRGNHETRQVNSKYTFMAECNERLGYFNGAQAWERFNKVFDYLSLAATIGQRIFCIHGGLGPDTTSISLIDEIPKPISYVEPPFSASMAPHISQMNRMLIQLLWNDPADSDLATGTFLDNPLRTGGNAELGISKFTSHVVNQFCSNNGVDMIFRAHQVVPEGIEIFAAGRLVTVFSATNYCGAMKNNGAIVLINEKLVISAKTIKCREGTDAQEWVDPSLQPPPSPPMWYS